VQLHGLRQVFELHAGRQVVEYREPLRLGVAVMELQAHFAPAAQRQVAAELALELGRRRATQPQGIGQRQQEQGAERAPPQASEQRRAGVQGLGRTQGDGGRQQDAEQREERARWLHRRGAGT